MLAMVGATRPADGDGDREATRPVEEDGVRAVTNPVAEAAENAVAVQGSGAKSGGRSTLKATGIRR